MRILWVKTGGLIPLDTGGKIRSYHLLRGLVRTHSVTLFTYYEAHENDRHEELRSFLERLVAIPLAPLGELGWRRAVDYARHLCSSEPYSMWRFNRPFVRKRLEEVCLKQPFDLILCDFLHPAGIIPWDDSARKVIFTHNVEGRIWQRQADIADNRIWRAVYVWNLVVWRGRNDVIFRWRIAY